jgi:sarcosine oxidase
MVANSRSFDADVIVVGAGVMGAATAWQLGMRGVSTVVCEQFALGHTRGSSHGPTRIFRFSDPQETYVRLAQAARKVWDMLEAEAGSPLLEATGGLDVGPHAVACAKALQASGGKCEWIEPAMAAEKFPAIAFRNTDHILYTPDSGVICADKAHQALLELARANGVAISESVATTGWQDRGDHVSVETSRGALKARVVVSTAGPWASRVLAAGGIEGLSLSPCVAQYSYYATEEPGLSMPTFIETGRYDHDAYLVPAADTAPGHKVGIAEAPAVDMADGPFSVDDLRLGPVRDYVKERFPGLRSDPLASETCLYTMTPDQDFVLDRVGSVVIGAGFSGHGFKFAPLVGKVLADLAMTAESAIPLAPFRANRASMVR